MASLTCLRFHVCVNCFEAMENRIMIVKPMQKRKRGLLPSLSFLPEKRLERSNRNMPVACCCHQIKNWWLPLFCQRRKCKRVSPLGSKPPVLPYLKRIPDYLPAGQQPQYNRRIFQEKFVVPSLVRLPSPKIGMTSPRYVGSGLKIQATQSFVRARISRKSRMN